MGTPPYPPILATKTPPVKTARATGSLPVRRKPLYGVDIGQREVPPFEEKWLASRLRQGVREAIAEVQCRRVIPLAESPPGPASGLGL
jgi:hypothetical protein